MYDFYKNIVLQRVHIVKELFYDNRRCVNIIKKKNKDQEAGK